MISPSDQLVEMIQKYGNLKRVSDKTGLSCQVLYYILRTGGVSQKTKEVLSAHYESHCIAQMPLYKRQMKAAGKADYWRGDALRQRFYELVKIGFDYTGSVNELSSRTTLSPMLIRDMLSRKPSKAQYGYFIGMCILEKFLRQHSIKFPERPFDA